MPSVGPMEMIVVLVIASIVLGPKRRPEAGESLGRGIREFQSQITGSGTTDLGDDDGRSHVTPTERGSRRDPAVRRQRKGLPSLCASPEPRASGLRRRIATA